MIYKLFLLAVSHSSEPVFNGHHLFRFVDSVRRVITNRNFVELACLEYVEMQNRRTSKDLAVNPSGPPTSANEISPGCECRYGGESRQCILRV